MKKYICFPSGRDIWFDITKSLKEKNIAEPIIWHGNNIHDNYIKKEFKHCIILDFFEINKGFTNDLFINYDISKLKFFINDNIDFYRIKDQVIKMMDRQDFLGSYRNIDKESVFYSILMYFFHLIEKKTPDFLLMTDSPHHASHYLIYEICKYLEIKTYSLVSSSILPILFLRNDIDGEYIKINNEFKNKKLKEEIINDIKSFNTKFKSENIEDPIYIKNQKKYDNFSFISIIKKAKMAYKTIGFLNKSFGYSSYKDNIGFLEVLYFHIISKNQIISINKKSLENVISKNINIYKNKYIYFPLHYEPERTSNPDGGKYYNQINALIELRNFIPNDIPIYVKEHYSQFSSILQGYRGRSRFFYKNLKKIPNIHVLESSIKGTDLIKYSFLTVTLSGTSSLEALSLGKKGMIMGNSWFEKINGLIKYNTHLSYEHIININNKNNLDDNLIDLINEYGFYGILCPDIKNNYDKYYKKYNFSSIEVEEITSILEKTIKNNH